jgi:uncharacterized protein (TIGR00730 family)
MLPDMHQPFRTFRRVCVFCGSNSGARPTFADAARSLGATLSRLGIGLVYGGGKVGLMGILADAMLAEEREVIGVIPEGLAVREVAHAGLSELRIVGSMHERKATMANLADAFIAMPGGFGTFEEFHEVVTWAQLGIHSKPCGLLNVDGYFDPLLMLFDRGVEERFIRPEHRALIVEDSNPAALVDRLKRFEFPMLQKWLDRDET